MKIIAFTKVDLCEQLASFDCDKQKKDNDDVLFNRRVLFYSKMKTDVLVSILQNEFNIKKIDIKVVYSRRAY